LRSCAPPVSVSRVDRGTLGLARFASGMELIRFTLEMAVHEEKECRALRGEVAKLEDE